MSIKATLMPYITQCISSHALKDAGRIIHAVRRKAAGKPPTIRVFLKTNDPYSLCLLTVLPELQNRFAVNWALHMVHSFENDMFPAPELLAMYSESDARYLADLYQLPIPELPELDDHQWQCIALNCQHTWHKTHSFKAVYETLSEQATTLNTQFEISADFSDLRQNEALRETLGHYNSAMLYFENEWYWGLDRLNHLEQRLNHTGLQKEKAEVRFNKTSKLSLSSQKITDKTPLTLYWSARSPYSYLALLRCQQLCEHYQVPLEVKPVMPMVMRNMPVPQNKKMYIFLDTKREADLLGIPYGKVADPVGDGVLRCYGLLEFAREQDRYLAFLMSFAKSVNSQGIRADTDKGMQIIVEQAGLNWRDAKQHLHNRSFQQEVDENLEELLSQGHWGVPCIKYADTIVWGQDRIAQIEQLMLARSSES